MFRVSIGTENSVFVVTLAIVERVVITVGHFVTNSVVVSAGLPVEEGIAVKVNKDTTDYN